MKYRLADIWTRQNYTADKTEPIRIDITQPISRITITYEPDNNVAGADAVGHPVRCISQITLDNGSDILYSNTGAAAQAVDFYDRNKVTPSIMMYLTGMYSEMIMNLNFGHYLFDPQWALLPEMFRNLFLNISIDIDAGGDAADDGYLTVFAHVFDEQAISPQGFIMTKEEKEYTLVSSGTEKTDLPVDYPYKQIFVRAQRYGTGPEYQIDAIKLREDNDKKIPVDCTMYQLLRNVAQQWSPYKEWIMFPGNTNAIYYYNTPGYWPAFTSAQWQVAPNAGYVGVYGGDGGRFQMQHATATFNTQVMCQGWAPHSVVPLLPKQPIEMVDMINFPNNSKLRLDLQGGSSVGTSQLCQVITQQYRNY